MNNEQIFEIDFKCRGGGGGSKGNFGEFWGTFFGELQKTRGTFPKFPKIPQKSLKQNLKAA